MQKTRSISKFISLIVFIQLKPSLKNNQHKTGTKYLKNMELIRDMKFQTMWHFDINRLRGACAASF